MGMVLGHLDAQVQQKRATELGQDTQGSGSRAIQLKGLSYDQGMSALSPANQPGYDVQHKALRPVQCKGGEGAVHAAAQEGTRGSGGTLPYLSQIQASFGRHDVTGISAHTGSGAGAACDQMGALAYASGNDVAFKSGPSLHTAAHEAAHIVQQRAGVVSLKGGVGQSGDVYEQHADAVADAVVQGKSAEGILDQMAGPGAASSSAVQTQLVQREADPGTVSVSGSDKDLGGTSLKVNPKKGVTATLSKSFADISGQIPLMTPPVLWLAGSIKGTASGVFKVTPKAETIMGKITLKGTLGLEGGLKIPGAVAKAFGEIQVIAPVKTELSRDPSGKWSAGVGKFKVVAKPAIGFAVQIKGAGAKVGIRYDYPIKQKLKILDGVFLGYKDGRVHGFEWAVNPDIKAFFSGKKKEAAKTAEIYHRVVDERGNPVESRLQTIEGNWDELYEGMGPEGKAFLRKQLGYQPGEKKRPAAGPATETGSENDRIDANRDLDPHKRYPLKLDLGDGLAANAKATLTTKFNPVKVKFPGEAALRKVVQAKMCEPAIRKLIVADLKLGNSSASEGVKAKVREMLISHAFAQHKINFTVPELSIHYIQQKSRDYISRKPDGERDGYVYRQYEDGKIKITDGPKGVGITYSRGPAWESMSKQINDALGPFTKGQ